MDKTKQLGTTNKALGQSVQANGASKMGGGGMTQKVASIGTTVKGSTMGASSMSSMKKQEKSSEEEIMEKDIQQVEMARLVKVFEQLRTARSGGQNTNNSSGQGASGGQMSGSSGVQANNSASARKGEEDRYFSGKDVAWVLEDLGYEANSTEVNQMIWEVDEDLDQRVSFYEFELMYRRCRHDTTGLEPRNLYNLVQFLMYLKSDPNSSSQASGGSAATASLVANKNGEQKKTITVEDTLELLYVRYGRQNLDKEIEEIFGRDEKNAQGEEKSITLKEYLDKQKKRDFAMRKELEAERKKVKMPENEKEKGY